jgi:hypothetical protein
MSIYVQVFKNLPKNALNVLYGCTMPLIFYVNYFMRNYSCDMHALKWYMSPFFFYLFFEYGKDKK